MAVENLSKIVERLIDAGKNPSTAIAIIEDASLLTQKVLTATLKDIVLKAKKDRIRPPAIIIIGEVARLEKRFDWLKNKRALFTGLSKERFFAKGIKYIHLPLIKIVPAEDYEEFDRELKEIRRYNWIVFTSRYGVEHFFKRLVFIGYDSRALAGIKIAAIGNSTKAALIGFGILADLVPSKESSSGLIDEFKKTDIKGKKIFLPRSDISDKGLEKAFSALGAIVTSRTAYRNVMPDDLPDLNLRNFSTIIFTSPSTVRNFKKRYGSVPGSVKIRSIGEVTAKEVKRAFSERA